MPWSIAANTANSVFVQFSFFGSAFVLFLSKLGLNKTQIGTLTSFFPFTGLIALVIAPSVARWGYKRTFITFWAARKIVTAFLLLAPLINAQFGSQATLWYVAVIVVIFAICRAVAETAVYPWEQEYVPASIRGKFTATTNIFSSAASFLAVAMGGFVLGSSPDLGRFSILFAVAVVFGLISVWAFSFIPGGASTRGTAAEGTSHRDLIAVTRDGNFRRYLGGLALVNLAYLPLAVFLPLFMQEQVGLSSGNTVWLGTGTLLGGVLSSYAWGWAADRYGSKPVMLSGLSLRVGLPLLWLFMPRQSDLSFFVALGIALIEGVTNLGWLIGSARLLFVGVVPPERKTEFMALYYAWMGTVGGLGQLLAGRLLDFTAGMSGEFLGLALDPYTLLFFAAVFFPILGALLLQSVQAESGIAEVSP